MKECDIFREGVKTYYDPSYIFSGGQDPLTPRIYAPGLGYHPSLYTAGRQVTLVIAEVQREVGNIFSVFIGPLGDGKGMLSVKVSHQHSA